MPPAVARVEPHSHDRWEIQRLAAIVESTDDAVIGTTLDGVITSWNAGAEQLFGYTAGEAVGSPFSIVLPPDLAGERDAMVSMLRRGERLSHYETRRRRKDGTDIEVSLTMSPILDSADRVVGVSCIIRDLVERRLARAEADRLKSEFFALVSHELRTPLTSIMGYVELLGDVEGERLSQQGRSFLETVQRNSERLDGLVQDVLMVAEIEAGAFEIELDAVDMARVAAKAVTDVRRVADQAEVTLALDVEDLPPFAGDRHRLRQALRNMLDNGIKFNSAGGRVSLSARAECGKCVIEVTDTGMGIDLPEQASLFERFYRARAADRLQVQGAGLGLSITGAIVAAHDGEIEIESEPGQGATFRVVLPMRPPAAAPFDAEAER